MDAGAFAARWALNAPREARLAGDYPAGVLLPASTALESGIKSCTSRNLRHRME